MNLRHPRYFGKLQQRLQRLGIPPADQLMPERMKARDAMQDLHAAAHYAGCEHAEGRAARGCAEVGPYDVMRFQMSRRDPQNGGQGVFAKSTTSADSIRKTMPKPTQILFVGNSFTGRNGLADMLTRTAAAAHPPHVVETRLVLANGMALKTHWDRGVALEAIRSVPWNFVVLQEQSTLPLKNRARMHEYVTRFAEEITLHGSAPVLYMTWARQNAWERQDELSEAYASIGRSLGVLVAPVGIAWQNVYRQAPEIVLHDKDQSHPNPAGSYLAACVFYAALFGKSPVGLTSEPSLTAKYGGKTIKLLQEVAWITAYGFAHQ